MSFAAVVALVAFYEEATRRIPPWRPASLWARAMSLGWRYMAGIALTTVVASVAIAPFAAYHFHKLAHYSLLANMLAMPIVGLAIMPAALATLLAMPFGLEAWPLAVMTWGIDLLIRVATAISEMDGAVIHVPTMSAASLGVVTLGGLWLALWRGRWRFAGLGAICLGLATGPQARPDLIVGRDGSLVAVRGNDGRLATADAARGYGTERWLLADGDERAPAAIVDPDRIACDGLACVAHVKGRTVAVVRHAAALAEECRLADILVAEMAVQRNCRGPRLVVDRMDVWAGGAHAIFLDGQSIRVETVAGRRGDRPWSPMRQHRQRPAATGAALAVEGGQ